MEQSETPSVTPGYRGARESEDDDCMGIEGRIALLVLAAATATVAILPMTCEDEPNDTFAIAETKEEIRDAGIEE